MIQAWLTIGRKILDVVRDQVVDHVVEDQVTKFKEKYLKKTRGK